VAQRRGDMAAIRLFFERVEADIRAHVPKPWCAPIPGKEASLKDCQTPCPEAGDHTKLVDSGNLQA
jgi:hypothetical protein